MNAGCDAVVALFVDGEIARSASTETIDVVNPSNGEVIGTLPAGCDADVDRAVASARAAADQRVWCGQGISGRKDVLFRFAELVAESASSLDRMDALEMGKPVGERAFSASSASRWLRFCGESVDKIRGDAFQSDDASLVLQRRVPHGVVAAITPWNFPTFNALLKIGPALAAGNSVVLKPSELSSSSALRLAQLAMDAGLPPGVLNVVPGIGSTVGRAMGRHADVDMIAFTGSTAVGRAMMHYSGESNLKPVLAECGGKSPQIIFDDGVDLDAAADRIANAILANQGQICSVGSRLLVQRSAERRVLERIAARFAAVAIGSATEPATTFGPLVSARQRDRVMTFISSATDDGLDLFVGGNRVLAETGGYFVEPTIFRNVPPAATIAQEEIFGPVLAVTSFDDAAEAVRIANGTKYGLAAYLWTADISTGLRTAKAIRSSVTINAEPAAGEGAGFAVSSEPAGHSGIGVEGGLAGIESYLRRQNIRINHA